MKVLLIDNYDSYTYNLYQLVGDILQTSHHSVDWNIRVVRNDELAIGDTAQFNRIIISPGPGDPSDVRYFGICAEILKEVSPKVPTLGVCLGMQGMAYAYGGKVIRAASPMHGKTSAITHDGRGVFEGLPQELEIMRYHSLIVDPVSLPECFEISARVGGDLGAGQSEIMGMRHRTLPIEGVQFHPESFATEGGREMLRNFLFSDFKSSL